MRVAHVITRLIVGGAQENTVATVLGLLRKPGVEVHLISGPSIGPEGSMEPLLAAYPGVLTASPDLVRPVHPRKDFLALRDLQSRLRALQPEIVHTHSGKAGILGRIAAKRAGVPVIIHHIHGPSFGDFQGPVANAVFTAAERYAGRLTDYFLCSAAAMARLYLDAGIGAESQYTRVFSGFEIEPFVAAGNDLALRQRLGFRAEDFIIGKIGRLVPLKGHEDLLRAFKGLVAEVPNARLLFVGDGLLRTRIEGLATDLGLRDKVVFTGLVSPGEVPKYTGIMDCLVHLSRREAVSRALPQALAAGKPVVSYDFQGADEVCIEGKTGFLVHMGDVARVTDKLLLLARDRVLRNRLGSAGQEFVRREFPVELMVEKIFAIYQQLLQTKGRAEVRSGV
jgi:glycosyltransferase involved in cell wall biosynthesis